MGKKNSYQKIDDIFKEVINQNSIPVEIVFQISKDTYLFAKFKFKSFLNLFLCTQGKKPSMPWYYGLSYKSYKIVEGNIKKLQIVQDNQHGITIFFPLIEYKIKEFIVTPDVVTVLFNKNIRSYYFINTSNISPVSINLTLEKYSQQDASTSDDILIYQTNRTEHHIFSLIQSFFGSMLVPQSDNIKEILLIHTGMTPLTKQCLVKVTGESFDSYINKHSLSNVVRILEEYNRIYHKQIPIRPTMTVSKQDISTFTRSIDILGFSVLEQSLGDIPDQLNKNDALRKTVILPLIEYVIELYRNFNNSCFDFYDISSILTSFTQSEINIAQALMRRTGNVTIDKKLINKYAQVGNCTSSIVLYLSKETGIRRISHPFGISSSKEHRTLIDGSEFIVINPNKQLGMDSFKQITQIADEYSNTQTVKENTINGLGRKLTFYFDDYSNYSSQQLDVLLSFLNAFECINTNSKFTWTSIFASSSGSTKKLNRSANGFIRILKNYRFLEPPLLIGSYDIPSSAFEYFSDKISQSKDIITTGPWWISRSSFQVLKNLERAVSENNIKEFISNFVRDNHMELDDFEPWMLNVIYDKPEESIRTLRDFTNADVDEILFTRRGHQLLVCHNRNGHDSVKTALFNGYNPYQIQKAIDRAYLALAQKYLSSEKIEKVSDIFSENNICRRDSLQELAADYKERLKELLIKYIVNDRPIISDNVEFCSVKIVASLLINQFNTNEDLTGYPKLYDLISNYLVEKESEDKDELLKTIFHFVFRNPSLTSEVLKIAYRRPQKEIAIIINEDEPTENTSEGDQKIFDLFLNEHGIAACSPKMLSLFREIWICSKSNSNILILGETGAGKNLVAKAIHKLSGRENELVKVNVNAVGEKIFDGDMFGSKEGSHSTANRDQDGYFIQADNGSIFLDEIGDLILSHQTKLLGVVDNGDIQLSGGEIKNVNVKIISATNVDIMKKITNGEFRLDLYMRLSGKVLEIPPLRSRKEDIPIIAELLFKKWIDKEGKEINIELSRDLFTPLIGRTWEGNIRELENYIHRIVNHFCLGEQSLDQLKKLILDPNDYDRNIIDQMLIENSDNQKQAPHIFESDSDICSEKEIHALNTLFKLNLNATAAIEELPFKSKNIFKKAINHALLKLGSRNKFDIEAIYSSITERNDENIPYDKQRCLDDINKRFKAMIGKDKIDPRHCGKDYEHLALELKKLRQN